MARTATKQLASTPGGCGRWFIARRRHEPEPIATTPPLPGGSHAVAYLASRSKQIIRILITPTSTVPRGTAKSCLVTFISVAEVTRWDSVRAVVTAKQRCCNSQVYRNVAGYGLARGLQNFGACITDAG